ncbi:MAG: ATP-binding protein [Candidatus Methanomethylophilus sp.]|nr:ATP-binding protein [Methanomethylophilus sp.]
MSARIFKRKIYQRLLQWKAENDGKSALLIEGARRVGKSTIVEEFAKNEYDSYLLIDFNQPRQGTIELFERYSHDIGLLTSNLSILYDVELKQRKSLVIFDEIQNYPKARALIKYLVADGRYDYIETGSLISLKENVKDITIPSEEEPVQMYPMDFEEWLWANGNENTMDLIREHFQTLEPFNDVVHNIILEKYRLYMITGGMPASVAAYLERHDIRDCEKVKRQIISLYKADMHKNLENGILTERIFESIPSRLSARTKVFRPGDAEKGELTENLQYQFDWLNEAKIVNLCLSNTDPNPAMNLNNDFRRFKTYLLDTGLLITLAFDTGIVDESVFISLAKSDLSINEGMLFENMVAQELVSAGHRLYFHEFYLEHDRKNLCEVDFILVKKKRIIPVEVKSARSTKHKSLDRFMEKYSARLGKVYVIHSNDIQTDGRITYLPIYMASLL